MCNVVVFKCQCCSSSVLPLCRWWRFVGSETMLCSLNVYLEQSSFWVLMVFYRNYLWFSEQEEIAEGKNGRENISDLPFPHWICQPYVRPAWVTAIWFYNLYHVISSVLRGMYSKYFRSNICLELCHKIVDVNFTCVCTKLPCTISMYASV